MHSQSSRAYLYVLFSILVWSGWIVVSRHAVKGPLSAYDITAIRFTVSGLILLPVVIKKGIKVGPWGVWGGVMLAACIGAPYTNLSVMGMNYAPASHASTVINGTLLISTTVVGVLLLKESTSPLRLIGVVCSLMGIICMLSAKGSGGNDEWKGHALFAISGIMWSGYTLLVRAWHADAMKAAGAVCVLSMVMYLPPYLMFVDSHITMEHWKEVLFQAFYQGVLTAVLALISFNAAIRILGASRAGAFIPLVPALSTLLAIPVLGEVPSMQEIMGVFGVSFGVLLASGVLRITRKSVND